MSSTSKIEDNNEKNKEINEQDNASQSELSSFDDLEECKKLHPYFTNNNEGFPNKQQVDYNNKENVYNVSNGEEQYEEMEEENIEQECQEEQGEEEYYEEQGEEMVEQINYADNIPKLEHSFNAESTNRLQLPSQVDESELNPFNMSICGPRYKKLHTCNKDCYNKNCLNNGKIIYAFGIGLGEPKVKLYKTVEVLKREFKREPKVSTQEDNIISAKTYSKLIEKLNKINDDLNTQLKERIAEEKANSSPCKGLYEVNTELKAQKQEKNNDLTDVKEDNIELTRKQESYDNLDHGWQYFNKYGKDDDKTKFKLANEIVDCWDFFTEEEQLNAWDAIANKDATKMNNIINNTFAQVTPNYQSNSFFNQF